MKFLWILLAVGFTAFSQGIHGIVVGPDKTPLQGANVYFDNSSLATITDADGHFGLNAGGKSNLILVVSFMGYQTEYIKDYDLGKNIYVKLSVAENSIREVVVGKQLFSRKDELKLFRKQFLGTSKAAGKATIENEDDLYFSYDEKQHLLQAFSDMPLVINNPFLAYKVTYELVSFKVGFNKLSIYETDINKVMFSGYARFEELSSDDEFQKRRETKYLGSPLHFYRTLASSEWNEKNFVIYKGGLIRNPAACFSVKDTLGMKKVTVIDPDRKKGKDFSVFYNFLYNNKERSRITFNTETFFVDYFGNYSDLESMNEEGAFAVKRVADMLPLNYGIK